MNGVPAKDQTRLKIEKMEAEREERRRLMQEVSVLVTWRQQPNSYCQSPRQNIKMSKYRKGN